MNKSDSIASLATALSAAQAVLVAARKKSENPFLKNKYADLAEIIEVSRQPLADNGLSYVQIPRWADGRLILETVLMHKSGEWISGELSLKPAKDDSQGLGGCISYARRYMLASFLGIGQQDDDGNESSGVTNAFGSKNKAPARDSIYRAVEPHKSQLWAICQEAKVNADQASVISNLLDGKPWSDLDQLIADAKSENGK